MHILFILLRVILIVLAVIVALIVLILVVPLLYSFQAEKKEGEPFWGRFQVTWFFRLLYFKAVYQDGKLDYRLLIFGRQLLGNQEEFKEKREARRERKAEKKAEKEKKKEEKDKKKEEKDEKEAQTQKSEAAIEQEKTETEKLETAKEEPLKLEGESAKPEDSSEESEEESEKPEDGSEKPEEESEESEEKSKKQRRRKRRAPRSSGQSGRSGSRMSSVLDMGKRAIAFLRGEEGKELLSVLKESIMKLLRHIMPRKIKGAVRFGFDDPSRTGMVTGLAALFYPRYCRSFTVTPDFMNACFEADCKGHGRIQVGYLVYIVIIVMRNANARKAIMSLFRGMR